VATLIIWLILDDLTAPMVWINRWTPLIGALSLAQVILYFVHNRIERREKETAAAK
jgi:hypothetical protein